MSEIRNNSEGFFDDRHPHCNADRTVQPLPKRGKGRPATGRTTKTVRVPRDLDVDKAIQMYYDWLPIIEQYRDTAAESPNSVRNEKLIRLMEELGIL